MRRQVADADRLVGQNPPLVDPEAPLPPREYRHRPGCQRFGTRLTGCPAGVKASTDLTHWPAALEAGAKLVTGARVREIAVDAQGPASGAVYVDRNGVARRRPPW